MKSLLLAVVALIGLTLIGTQATRWSSTPAVPAWTSCPTIELESLGDLVCLRVHVADILVGETDSHRGLWIVRGDAILAIDLRQAKIVECDTAARCARIRLPLPMVLSARVDHEKSRTWSVEKTTWMPWAGDPDQLRDEAMRQAQRLIQSSSGSIENLQLAKQSAVAIVEAMFGLVDWRITVAWAEPRKS